MHIGQPVVVKGHVTQLKYLAGRPLREIESLLGYHPGRLAKGASYPALKT